MIRGGDGCEERPGEGEEFKKGRVAGGEIVEAQRRVGGAGNEQAEEEPQVYVGKEGARAVRAAKESPLPTRPPPQLPSRAWGEDGRCEPGRVDYLRRNLTRRNTALLYPGNSLCNDVS